MCSGEKSCGGEKLCCVVLCCGEKLQRGVTWQFAEDQRPWDRQREREHVNKAVVNEQVKLHSSAYANVPARISSARFACMFLPASKIEQANSSRHKSP